MKSMRTKKIISNTIVYIILSIMCVIWLIPIVWLFLQAFRLEAGGLSQKFFPIGYTFRNFATLFTDKTYNFTRWFLNTLLVAVCSCVITTIITLATAYVMSRFRFKSRKMLMKIALILGMFPGFMSMIAVYYILKALSLEQTLIALILVYSGAAGLSFYISKGFFDTVPKVLDESARLDGASRAMTFFKIVLPLSKPIIVYTALMAFMAPWGDFIFAKIIMGDAVENYTVAIGLYKLIDKENIDKYFTTFAAGSVVVAVVISAVFIALQKYYVAGITGGAVKG